MIAGFYVFGELDRVVDGDTIDIRLGSLIFRVRLVDCWAPEKRTRNQAEKALGILSWVALSEMLSPGERLRLDVVMEVDGDLSDWLTFGRIVGAVSAFDSEECRWFDLSSTMVARGFAFPTKKALRAYLDSISEEEAADHKARALEALEERGKK